MEEIGNKYKILVAWPEIKSPIGRTRNRWKVNIRMNLWKIG
jgi:hypothetical protein